MACNDKEWIWNCKYHPKINHFHISSFRQWLGYSHEAKNVSLNLPTKLGWTYNVVRTKRRVVLTSMTISRKVLLKVVDIWLINSSIPVGRNKVTKWPVSGLLKLMSTNTPSLPYLLTLQYLRPLNWYLPKSWWPLYVTFLNLVIRITSPGNSPCMKQFWTSKGYHPYSNSHIDSHDQVWFNDRAFVEPLKWENITFQFKIEMFLL